jgi:hypothetical protein
VPTRSSFDHAVIRVVPRVERAEFVNAGVILFCRTRRYLAAKTKPDEARLRALWPDAVRAHLAAFERVAAGGPGSGPIGRLPTADRFHWLTRVRRWCRSRRSTRG